jgi:hypothetical protein
VLRDEPLNLGPQVVRDAPVLGYLGVAHEAVPLGSSCRENKRSCTKRL